MSKTIITSDSTADLDYLFAERNIPVMPLTVLLGEREGLDGVEITPKDIYEYFDKNQDYAQDGGGHARTVLRIFQKVYRRGLRDRALHHLV